MMQQIQHYGEIDKPEEIKKVEINQDPVQIIRSTYKLWLPEAKISKHYKNPLDFSETRTFFRDNLYCYPEVADELYGWAARLLKPHANAFKDLEPKQLETILSTVNEKDTRASGLFLSAMLNETDMLEMSGIFQRYFLGYRLEPGKTLTPEKGSEIVFLGNYSKGTIFNYGESVQMAHDAQGGVQINFGNIERLGDNSESKVVNYGFATHMSELAKGGIHLNFGEINFDLLFDKEGNKGLRPDVILYDMSAKLNEGPFFEWPYYGSISIIEQGMKVNYGSYFIRTIGNPPIIEVDIRPSYSVILSEDKPIKVSLDEDILRIIRKNFEEIRKIKNLEDKPNQAVEAIASLDWQFLLEEISRLGKQIEDSIR